MTEKPHKAVKASQRMECAQLEKRVHPRLRCKGVVELRVLPEGEAAVGSLFDLSKRGCCILSHDPLPAFEHSHVEVQLKIKGMSLRLAGIVRHIHGRTKAGIEFLDLSARKAAQIEELMTEVVQMGRTAAWARQMIEKAQKLN